MVYGGIGKQPIRARESAHKQKCCTGSQYSILPFYLKIYKTTVPDLEAILEAEEYTAIFFFFFLPRQIRKPVIGKLAAIALPKKANIFVGKPPIAPT